MHTSFPEQKAHVHIQQGPARCQKWHQEVKTSKRLSPPIRKSSPATYCMSSCCLQHPSTPMIHPNRMMETAMPMKPAVILRRSKTKQKSKNKMKMVAPKQDVLLLTFLLTCMCSSCSFLDRHLAQHTETTGAQPASLPSAGHHATRWHSFADQEQF